MRRTCYTCYYHKDEDGYIKCGFNGHCINENNYKPFRGSVEEMQMALDPWRKAMALYEAKLLNRHDGIFASVAIDIGKGRDKSVITVYDKLHKTIEAHILSTDNPDKQGWLKQFLQEEK